MVPGPDPLSADEHRHRGTYRRDRHQPEPVEAVEGELTAAQRQRLLAGMPAPGKAILESLLATYCDWSPDALALLRVLGFAFARVEALQVRPKPDPRALALEVQTTVRLLQALKLLGGAAETADDADDDRDDETARD
jgi:hypothetical protein